MAATPLWHALGICPGDVVAFTGGGGKTSLALALARELSLAGHAVVYTCTARMYPAPGMPLVLTESPGWVNAVQEVTRAGRPVCLGGALEPSTGKLLGLSGDQVAMVKDLRCGVTLVEADGSAGLPLKFPAAHEPVIPPVADLVVPVAGASVLGKPLTPAHVHRAALVAGLGGWAPGEPVTPSVVAEALIACTRGTPPGARVVPVLGQADTPGTGTGAAETARLLLRRAAVGRVVLAAPVTPEPVRVVVGDVAAIVLAAGASRRFGSPKLLHRMGEKHLIEHTLSAVLRAGLRSVTVVTGAYDLASVLSRYPVTVVQNADWHSGMASSLRAGIESLTELPSAILVCLGDQPFLQPEVLNTLVSAYREHGAPIVAPVAGGLRQNPVLFDRSLIPELLAVQGDEGGRSVIRRHAGRLLSVPFPDARWFADVDLPGDGHRSWGRRAGGG